ATSSSCGFSHTHLAGILRGKGVRQLFLSCTATNCVVDSTARYGAELGYDITVLEDCCQGFSDELHDFAVEKTLPYYATIMKSSDFTSIVSTSDSAPRT